MSNLIKQESRLIIWVRLSLIRLLRLSLVLYIAYLLAQLTWFVWPSSMSDKPDMWVFNASGSNSQSTRPAYNAVKYHLFGTRAVAPTPVVDSNKPAPRTNLQLVLNGVFAGDDTGGVSGAIVAERGRPSNYYRIGDALPGNAELMKVFEDHILLKRNGKLETLFFETAGVEGSKSKVVAVKQTATEAPKNISSPKEFVAVATRQLAENPQAALASVGLNVVREGEEQGYVFNGNNPMLKGLNLKRGDVIKSVNGYNLGNIRQDKKLLQQLYEEGSLEVEVVRGGTSFYINYPLK